MKRTTGVPLAELVLRVLAESYPLDPTTPGLVLAYLPDKNMFYGSICRYEGRASAGNPPTRQVLKCTQEATLQEVITELAEVWCLHAGNTLTLLQQNQPMKGKAIGNKTKTRRRSRSTPARKSVVRGTKG